MARRTKATKKAEATIYIGPSRPGLNRNTVFKNGELLPHVAAMVDENPHLGGLIVPISQYQESIAGMRTAGNILNTHLKKLFAKEN